MTTPTHQQNSAVLLVNLGTPESLTVFGIYKFLRAFLLDRRVINLPRLLWWLILHIIILPFRTTRVLKLYQNIWTQEGSPLHVWTERLAAQLEKKLKAADATGTQEKIPVYYAMTYGTPNIPNCLKLIEKNHTHRLIIIPLFPQYSSTTTGAIFDKITDYFKKNRYIPSMVFINEYATEESYIEALKQSIVEHCQQYGYPERLLFSFHGIPVSYEQAGDPYPTQCRNLVSTVASHLNLSEETWELGFQSRFGLNRWLKPSTVGILKRWALDGVKSIAIVSPSFSVDCLETLEELNIQYRKTFIQYGGKIFQYIPALNDSAQHIEVLKALVDKYF